MQEIQLPLTDEPMEKKRPFVEAVFRAKEVQHPRFLFERENKEWKIPGRKEDTDMTLEQHLQGISPGSFLKVHTCYVDYGAGQVFQLYGGKLAKEVFGLRTDVEQKWEPKLIRVASINSSPDNLWDLFAWYIAPHNDENYAALNGIFRQVFDCDIDKYQGVFVREVR